MESNLEKANECPQTFSNNADELDIREIFIAIRQGKWLIILITACFAIASVFYAVNQPNIYKSEALLAPVEQDSKSGLGALAGQFGGLASLAGVNLGINSRVDKTKMALAVLKSRQFVGNFIEKHGILPELMAVKSWDKNTNSLIYNEDLFNPATNEWLNDPASPDALKPSKQKAYKVFTNIFNTEVSSDTGMVILSVEHVSPYIAQQWVNWLVADINEAMKERDVIEANESTQFLTAQLEQTKVADIRSVLYKLVEEQAKTIMFANVRDEYVFKTIDPAVVPELKFKPKRALICVLGVILGGMVSVFFVLTHYFIRRS
ncbi:Wzz/FepE/Etk N-terminal domain-containing protein [Pseudoalteromonas arabiensis]|uniref:Wzz/FepE/Etk N-terminal domain-containing protein n=1 Tax=Pseudoalteromonas arabiensis TaxID=874454 RepID=UPI0007858833|nr:Wzz/FepE/Etk N-terminal domain-containing protein [Pseudoalteromonas arabiensis]